ncbi:MAG: hypothetical protein JW704_05315 [Anaerolineaceae bacterium]|nr:hypothetical protein [Anaerolineaceae bacterium]
MEKDYEIGIRELIKRNLPSQTAEELRKALDEFARLREDYKILKGDLDEARTSRDRFEKMYKTTVAEVDAYKKEHEDLMKVRAELAELKEALRIQKYEIELEKTALLLGAAEKHRMAMEAFMINMSRNSLFKKTTLSEKSYVVPPTPGLAGEYGPQREPIAGYVETKEDKVEEIISEE